MGRNAIPSVAAELLAEPGIRDFRLGHVAPVRRGGRWIAYEPLPVFNIAATHPARRCDQPDSGEIRNTF
jgi:hypothetical protein